MGAPAPRVVLAAVARPGTNSAHPAERCHGVARGFTGRGRGRQDRAGRLGERPLAADGGALMHDFALRLLADQSKGKWSAFAASCLGSLEVGLTAQLELQNPLVQVSLGDHASSPFSGKCIGTVAGAAG